MTNYMDEYVTRQIGNPMEGCEYASANPIVIQLGSQYAIEEKSGDRTLRVFYSPELAAHRLGLPLGQLQNIMTLRAIRTKFMKFEAAYLSDEDLTKIKKLMKKPSIASRLWRSK